MSILRCWYCGELAGDACETFEFEEIPFLFDPCACFWKGAQEEAKELQISLCPVCAKDRRIMFIASVASEHRMRKLDKFSDENDIPDEPTEAIPVTSD